MEISPISEGGVLWAGAINKLLCLFMSFDEEMGEVVILL